MQDEQPTSADPARRAKPGRRNSALETARPRSRAQADKKIDQNAARIEDDDYVFVILAGNGIPRLEARPLATPCIDCANLQRSRKSRPVAELPYRSAPPYSPQRLTGAAEKPNRIWRFFQAIFINPGCHSHVGNFPYNCPSPLLPSGHPAFRLVIGALASYLDPVRIRDPG